MNDRREIIEPGITDDTSIVIDGKAFDIGVRVVKWYDKGGFSGYGCKSVTVREKDDRSEGYKVRRIRGARFGKRKNGYDSITQFMFHHTGGDGDGAKRVFNTLHNQRGLSVHFVIDDDGTVFQFLDPFAKAWHAGSHNNCSIGVELNLFPLVKKNPNYYSEKRNARTNNVEHNVGISTRHNKDYHCFMMPELQVDSAARLAAGVWAGLYDVTGNGRFATAPMFPAESDSTSGFIAKGEVQDAKDHIGLIGHFHATRRKIDPLGVDLYQLEGKTEEFFELATSLATCEEKK